MTFAIRACAAAASAAAPAARASRLPRVAASSLPSSKPIESSRVASSTSASTSMTYPSRRVRRDIRVRGARSDENVPEGTMREGPTEEDEALRNPARFPVDDADGHVARDEEKTKTKPVTKPVPNPEPLKNASFASYFRSVEALTSRIKDLGMAGVTCYGLLNTAYYTLAFTAAWSFSTIESGLSARAAFGVAGRCAALVWAGSQVTKAARLGLAVAGASKLDAVVKTVCAKTGWVSTNVFLFVIFGCLVGSAAIFGLLIVAKAAFA